MKTILAAIDFSPVTTRVVTEAVALARRTGAHLILLNVTTAEGLIADYAAFEAVLGGIDPGSTNGAGVAVHGDSLQVIGDPVDAILEQARRCSADYIILGSHGRSRLFEALVGGTASGVIRGAACPVIVVPARDRTSRSRKPSLRPTRPVDWLRHQEKQPARPPGSSFKRMKDRSGHSASLGPAGDSATTTSAQEHAHDTRKVSRTH